MTYMLNPECLYVESADVLWQADDSDAPLTEFGRQFAKFHLEIQAQAPPLFDLKEWTPEIAVVHAEDGSWGRRPWPERKWGLLGGEIRAGRKHHEWFKVWYHLMRGQADPAGLWEYPNPVEVAKRTANSPGGNEHNPTLGPCRLKRVDPQRQQSRIHSLFHPLNNTVVLDQFFEARHLRHANLIFVTGSYAPERIWPLVEKQVADGATCLCQKDIAPARYRHASGTKVGAGYWWTVDDFFSLDILEIIMPFRGAPQQWRLKMMEHESLFYATDACNNRIGWDYL